MSDGLKAIAASLAVSSVAPLLQMGAELFEGNEVDVHQFVCDYYRRYRAAPQVRTVQEETGVSLPTPREPLAFYVDRVYERHTYNLIRERFTDLREGLSRIDIPAVAQAVSAMHQATRQQSRRGLETMNIAEVASLVQDRLSETRGLGGITGIRTGWRGYDEITGGYQRGDLISIVGRPSLGKTYVLLRQATKAHEEGASVLVVTTEMSLEQMGRRHTSLSLGIDPTVLRRNMISSYVERRIRNFYRDMRGAERFNVFAVGLRSKVSAIEALMQEYAPDIVYVDGAYLLNPTNIGRSPSRTERITAVFDELKALTLDADRPIVVTTQFNRQAGKGGAEGSLENIGYTDAIGTHSSIVTALRPGPTTDPKKSRWFDFLKGREGETGKIAINFKFAPLDMEEFQPEEDGTEGGASTTRANVDWMA